MNNYIDIKNIKAFSEYSKLEEAGQVIRNGGLVLFPTETVYGLGANGLNSEAVKNIYVAKGRSSDNPLILHISGYFGLLFRLCRIEKLYKVSQLNVTSYFEIIIISFKKLQT